MFNNAFVRTIIMSNVLLQLGIWIRNFAILLYVTDITNNNPKFVSLISVAEFTPIFLFAIIGGTFADRWRPKRTMIVCDLLSALSVFAVLLVVMYGSWQALFFATLVSAILSQFSQPSALKLFKQHVPEEQLQGVMAMFQTLMAIFMVFGPILGTFVYQHYGLEISIAVMGVCFIASAAVLTSLPADQKNPAKAERNFMQEMKDGLRYVWSSRALKTLGGTFAVCGFAVGIIQPLMLFIAIENLGQDKLFLQWLLAANGIAMLAGGGVVMALSKKMQPQSLLAAGLVVSTVGTIGIGLSASVPLTIFFQVVNGLFYPCIMIGINTMMMKNTEAAFIGRVGGVLTPLFMGFMVIGMSGAGFIKETLSLQAVYTGSGILFFLGALLLVPLMLRRPEPLGEIHGTAAAADSTD
ncbi:MFS transporter [Paenibacillus sp. UNC499MF]|uniref:MFS transporter n=1 Tax=Paenibacillus sp. UNC499MF TaxID=1502751 RepID=UPI00089FF541|nr:MFS transporter [Paenibacillus sp. UNC499MF]SEF68855.1 Predicted arabinose efflux permease, MFS family [Paenibacillus sp. UNC499MF]